MAYFFENAFPFNLLTGGRGTGKTYGGLKYVIENRIKFIYMRRTKTEAEEIENPELSPFKSLNTDYGWTIEPYKVTKNVSMFARSTYENGKPEAIGEPLGYLLALSTVANIRGFDASDVEVMLYDEFIPEKHKSRIKNEADALFNCYETINRNRELKGLKPLKLICMSNSNNIANEIYMQLELVDKVCKMQLAGQEILTDDKRGLLVCTLQNSEISRQKSKTALYKLTENTSFSQMAIENNFQYTSRGKYKSMPLKEYEPVVSWGEVCVWIHKSRHELYFSSAKAKNMEHYSLSKIDTDRFRIKYNWIWHAVLQECVVYERMSHEILFYNYWNRFL